MEKHHTTETNPITPQGDRANSETATDERTERLNDTLELSEEISTDDTGAEETVATEGTDIMAELAQVKEEARIYQDRWTRLAAEFDNYKKRINREFGALVKNANESLISQLLPALDNINRALQAPQTTEETKSFAQGFELIQQQLWETLRKEGLQEIDAVGQPFDPMKHEAIMAIERDDHPAETIVEEVEKGYLMNDKVLRPTKVIVSRAPNQMTSGYAASSEAQDS